MAAPLTRPSEPRGAVVVRAFRDADLARCAAIFAAGTATALKRAPPDEPVGAFREATRGEIVLVAELEGRIAGFAGIFAPEAFVHHLYVDEAMRGRGVGAALLREVMKRLRRRVALKCRLDNEAALAFYRHLGWREAERGSDPESGAWVRFVSPVRGE